MAETMTGGCQCGRVRYTAEVESDDAYWCHCRMCQRATGGVAIAFMNLRQDQVNWECEPDEYGSSSFSRRGFCAQCGTSLSFRYVDSAKIDLTVGSFDDPYRFKPTSHFGVESRHEAWIAPDGLPEMRSDAYQPLIDKWMNALGKLPD